MTTSPYLQGGNGIPVADHPENFRPQLWIINFELRTAI